MNSIFKGLMMKRQNGFTLVELAIVLMIIGLLIGGILKGQELIQNARITTFLRQLKSADAATITFQDSYAALPGDIRNPSARLPDCTTSGCTITGDSNGYIGPLNSYGDENNSFWLHLNAAKLISGIDSNATWTSAALYTSSYPSTSLDGAITTRYLNHDGMGFWPNGLSGHYWTSYKIDSAGTRTNVTPFTVFSRIDLKIDDGNPRTGDVAVGNTACGVTASDTQYPTSSQTCSYIIKTQF